MKKLYKVTAYYFTKQSDYYVVANDPTQAEEKVVIFHQEKGYSNVDYCHIERLAADEEYGKPNTLLITK